MGLLARLHPELVPVRLCQNCHERPGTPFWNGFGAGRRSALLCPECVAELNHIGMDWQPERRSDPTRPDRGVKKPVWLELAAFRSKDYTVG